MEEQIKINQYKHFDHSVGVSMYHLEWCTKYWYKMFKKVEIQKFDSCLYKTSSKEEWNQINQTWSWAWTYSLYYWV